MDTGQNRLLQTPAQRPISNGNPGHATPAQAVSTSAQEQRLEQSHPKPKRRAWEQIRAAFQAEGCSILRPVCKCGHRRRPFCTHVNVLHKRFPSCTVQNLISQGLLICTCCDHGPAGEFMLLEILCVECRNKLHTKIMAWMERLPEDPRLCTHPDVAPNWPCDGMEWHTQIQIGGSENMHSISDTEI